MARRTRKQLVGKAEDYERREREKAVRLLRGELRRQWWQQRTRHEQGNHLAA